jgi:hypothetical protein
MLADVFSAAAWRIEKRACADQRLARSCEEPLDAPPRHPGQPSNALTSVFNRLDPIPQFKATAKLGGFLAQLPA